MEAHREIKITLTLSDEEADKLSAILDSDCRQLDLTDSDFAREVSDALYDARYS